MPAFNQCLKRGLRSDADSHVDLRAPNFFASDYIVIDHDGVLYPTDEARMLSRIGRVDSPSFNTTGEWRFAAKPVVLAGAVLSETNRSNCCVIGYLGFNFSFAGRVHQASPATLRGWPSSRVRQDVGLCVWHASLYSSANPE